MSYTVSKGNLPWNCIVYSKGYLTMDLAGVRLRYRHVFNAYTDIVRAPMFPRDAMRMIIQELYNGE